MNNETVSTLILLSLLLSMIAYTIVISIDREKCKVFSNYSIYTQCNQRRILNVN